MADQCGAVKDSAIPLCVWGMGALYTISFTGTLKLPRLPASGCLTLLHPQWCPSVENDCIHVGGLHRALPRKQEDGIDGRRQTIILSIIVVSIILYW